MFLYKSARLVLAVLCGLTVAVAANAAKTEPKRDAATPKAKAAATPAQVTYTNADLEKLPTPENDSLPSLEPPPDVTPLPPVPPSEPAQPEAAPATPAPAPETAPATPGSAAAPTPPKPNADPQPPAPAAPPPKADAPGEAAPVSAARVDPQTIAWVEGQVESLKLEAAIVAARRRVDEATAMVGRFRGTLRPDGSAFPADTIAAEEMYVRDLADENNRYDAALQRAYDEQAAARAELQGLLSGSAVSGR